MSLIILSVDPQVGSSAFAFHCWQGDPTLIPKAVATIDTVKFIKNHAKYLYAYLLKDVAWEKTDKKIAIIEAQYISMNGEKPDKIQSVLRLSKAANRMAGALMAYDFEIIDAPVWGQKKSWVNPGGQVSWVQEMFHVRGLRCNRAHNKRMSMQLAKSIYPNIRNYDEADAVSLGQWWWQRNKVRLLGQ